MKNIKCVTYLRVSLLYIAARATHSNELNINNMNIN
jgi:hypothetical protein